MTSISRVASMTVHPRLYPMNEEEDRLVDSDDPFCINVEFTEYDRNLETLVLLHGYLGSINDYKPAFDRLSGEFNLIAIDLRGHGQSGTPNVAGAGWEMRDLANDITQVVDLLIPSSTSYSVLASSMSTAIAMEMASTYPSRIERLFLLSPTLKFSIPAWIKALLGLGKISPLRFVESVIDVLSVMVKRLASDQEKEYWEDGIDRFNHIELDTHRKIFAETLANWEGTTDSIHQPVFIMAGSNDKVVPYKDSVELAEQLPNASLLTIEGGEHHLIHEYDYLIFDLVQQWMNSTRNLLHNKFYQEDDIEVSDGLNQVKPMYHSSSNTSPAKI